MVTIDPDKSIQSLIESKPASHQATTQTGQFDAIFRQTLGEAQNDPQAVASADFSAEVRPAQFMRQAASAPDLILDRAQSLIDTMEVYQQKLEDPRVTLRDLQPLMEQLSSQADALSTASEEGVGDAGLNTIVNQSLTLSTMEIARFRSGAYNDK